MSIIVVTTVIASLFLVIGLAEPLATRLRLPYIVILAVLGILIAAAAAFLLRTDLTDALNPAAEAILGLPIRSNVFLYVFLPTLLFQATLGMNVRRILDDWVPILVLAVVAVVVSTLAVGYALSWVTPFSLAVCLLIGSIVSTTDPSAVVAIFRSIAAPRRLARLIEGESLMNDAAAIALFGIFIGFVIGGPDEASLGGALARFPLLMLGGALTGGLMARLAVGIMALFPRHVLAQISVSVALPYLAYITAEQSVGASGVIAVVTAGLVLNLTGPGRLSPAGWGVLREVWDVLAHWAGALIFLLAALLIPRLLAGISLIEAGLILVVVAAAIVARALMLFGVLPLLTYAGLSPVIEPRYRVAILWGGLRGAVTLALAMAVTESFLVPPEIRRIVGILGTGFVLFTLIVQGSSLRWMIARLGLDRLSPLDTALSNQVIAVALQTVREDVARMTDNYGLTREIVRAEAKAFGERLDQAVRAAEDSTAILDRDRITLGLIALADAERDLLVERFRQGAISLRLAEKILSDADRLVESTHTSGRIGYRRATNEALAFGPQFRAALLLYNRLRLSGRLARLTADRFEILLSQRLILHDLHYFIDTRIRRIHGRRVAELLHELLERRVDAVEQALDGLRLQYPGYAEELERRYIRRTALRLEEREYDALRAEGLIGAELHTDLVQKLAARRAREERRPPLDLAVQRAELARQFPLFSELDAATLRRLGRALVTRYADPGEIILSRDAAPDTVFFIASGAVELRTIAQTYRLGRGEMFGQMAILTRSARRTEARAIVPCTLLTLDEDRFLRLLDRSPEVREAVMQSAAKRGIPPEIIEEGRAGPRDAPPAATAPVPETEALD